MQSLGVKTVSIAGSGNVGSFLAIELHAAGFEIKQIYSRTLVHAEDLAKKVNAIATDNIQDIDREVDLLIIALPDHAILDFVSSLDLKGRGPIIASTAGALELIELQNLYNWSGVIYPLQSFTKYRHPIPSIIPFCIEGSDNEIAEKLSQVAHEISKDVRFVDSEKRKHLHLAAVFACNFTNHMMALSERILENAQIDPDIMLPLVKETIDRLKDHNAIDMQTGPAVRKDWNTIQKHLDLIGDDEKARKIYELITDNIILLNNYKESQ